MPRDISASHVAILPAFPDEPVPSELIAELDCELMQLYPPAHMFGLHKGEARDSRLHFFVLTVDDSPAGCGALRLLGDDIAELKRMYVRPEYRGAGLARRIIRKLEEVAAKLGVRAVRLETGPEQKEAIALYRSEGYDDIPVYGEYVGSPVSFCMEKILPKT